MANLLWARLVQLKSGGFRGMVRARLSRIETIRKQGCVAMTATTRCITNTNFARSTVDEPRVYKKLA